MGLLRNCFDPSSAFISQPSYPSSLGLLYLRSATCTDLTIRLDVTRDASSWETTDQVARWGSSAKDCEKELASLRQGVCIEASQELQAATRRRTDGRPYLCSSKAALPSWNGSAA